MTGRPRSIRHVLTAVAAAVVMAAAAGAALPGHGSAATPTGAQSLTVHFHPVGGSGVKGSVRLDESAAGTESVLRVRGLRPGATVQSRLYAGSCARLDRLSASFSRIADFRANGAGEAAAAARVHFHEGLDVPIWSVADGEHVIVIVQETAFVSCAAVPRLSTWIRQLSIGLGQLGLPRSAYERAYGPPSRVDRIERSLSVLVFGPAHVSVYMRGGKGVALSTTSSEFRTSERVGPCSPLSDLRRAYGDRLRLVLKHRVVQLYAVGNLVFRVAHGRVGAVTVGKGALAKQIAGNSTDCGAT